MRFLTKPGGSASTRIISWPISQPFGHTLFFEQSFSPLSPAGEERREKRPSEETAEGLSGHSWSTFCIQSIVSVSMGGCPATSSWRGLASSPPRVLASTGCSPGNPNPPRAGGATRVLQISATFSGGRAPFRAPPSHPPVACSRVVQMPRLCSMPPLTAATCLLL